ncbi:MAG: cytochrome c biogenesis protein CcsA [Verrucomicrobia bacterium]|nr:cytochrome c biogenesis protein CcsA [Verrucomicrobiota bacterium]
MKTRLLKLIPWLLLAVFALEIIAILVPKPDKGLRVQDFGRLPVLLNGRVQPLDSVGRNALLQIRGTASVPLEEKKSYEFWKHPKKLKATEWIMEVMMKPDLADTRPIFLIHHPDLLNELDLRGKGKEKSGLFYFTFNELTNCIEKIEKEGQQVMTVDAQVRTAYQKQVAKVHNALGLYRRLKNTLQHETTHDFAKEFDEFKASIPAGVVAAKAREAKKPFDKAAFDRFVGWLGKYDFMARFAYPLLVPPAQPQAGRDQWQNMGQVLFEMGIHSAEAPPAVGWFAQMATAYRHDQPAAFNQALDGYRQWLGTKMGKELNKGRQEFFFNNLQAFLHAMIIYICAFLLAVGAMLTMTLTPNGAEAMRRSSLYLIILAWLVHTGGLIFRMWLERRPPVTNLYSSAIFIGWMAVLLGIILERIYRVGIGAAVASVVGFVTLVIAHNLALGGDTMEMLRAVLDTNFWLATHVVTVTLGYAATFVAGFLGIVYVLVGLFTPLLAMKVGAGGQAGNGDGRRAVPVPANAPDIGQALAKMVYGIVCFATLFSFVGTVLGGIWADQSWGRFWGWDPKENGALIIVLWNAIILHARWGGLVRERGLMNLAIFGNIVTAFSWFGVNMLGIGLHSYGFMDAAFKWLMIFDASQIFLIALGTLPPQYWRSFRVRAGAKLAPAPAS